MKSSIKKHKYKGVFNWKGENFELYRWAKNEDSAFWLFCKAIAEKVGYQWRYVYNYFVAQTTDNFRMERIK